MKLSCCKSSFLQINNSSPASRGRICYSWSITLCLLNKMGSMHWKNNSQELDAYFPVFFNPSQQCEFLGYGGEGHKIQTTWPCDQQGKDIPISCTLNSKTASVEGFPCGTYDKNTTNIQMLQSIKELHCEALHHMFSSLLISAFFFLYHSFSADCNI